MRSMVGFVLFVLVVMFVVFCCSGCGNTQEARARDMAEAHRLVAVAFPGMSEEEQARASVYVYSEMQRAQTQRDIAAGQILAQGFSDAGAQIANANRPVYVVPQYNPAASPVFNPVPITSANPYSFPR